jgi:probable HAF family extracellular repeat protein
MARMFPLLAGAALSHIALAQTATFTPLGTLDPTNFYSVALGISDDGRYVVGASHHDPSNDEAFRWDRINGMVPLGWYVGGYALSVANAVGLNGTVAGHVAGANGADWQPARWVYPTPPMNLGALPGGTFNGDANGVSADGTVIAGYTRFGNPTEAFRWSAQTGMVGLGNVLGAGGSSWGNAISSDGSTIVGWTSVQANGGYGQAAFRWTSAGGMVSLGDMRTVGAGSAAYAVSADGSYVVGEGTVDGGPNGYQQVAFRWHGFMMSLGWLPGGSYSRAEGVTADGTTVVGYGTSNSPYTWYGYEAFIWDPVHGMRSLRDVLINEHGLGATLAGWVLGEAKAITPDGRFVVGWGINPSAQEEAWLLDLGGACYANCDGSTTAPILNVADFSCFLNAFAAGDSYANCDGSTTPPVLTVADFGCFLNAFAAGCS